MKSKEDVNTSMGCFHSHKAHFYIKTDSLSHLYYLIKALILKWTIRLIIYLFLELMLITYNELKTTALQLPCNSVSSCSLAGEVHCPSLKIRSTKSQERC